MGPVCVSYFTSSTHTRIRRGGRGSTILGDIWLARICKFIARNLQQLEVLAAALGRAVGDLAKLRSELGVVEVGLGDQTHALHVVVRAHGGNKVPDVGPALIDAIGEVVGVGFETGVCTGQCRQRGRGGDGRAVDGGAVDGGTGDGVVWGCEGDADERERHRGVEHDVGKHCSE